MEDADRVATLFNHDRKGQGQHGTGQEGIGSLLALKCSASYMLTALIYILLIRSTGFLTILIRRKH